MNIKNILFIGIILVALNGCVSLPPEAAKVQLHAQVSNLLDGCKKLGPITGEGSRAVSYSHATETAKVDIRLKTASIGGDTVAVINTDAYWNKVVMQGVAYKCY